MSPVAMTDGGIETVMLFHEGLDLPCFASFPLLYDERGREALRRYFEQFLDAADRSGSAFILDTVTWRANPDWGTRLGYDEARLAQANRDAVEFAREVAGGREGVTICGLLGPRGDGYVVGERMSAEEAQGYHGWQIAVLHEAGAERIHLLTATYVEEAIGVVRAAVERGLPVAPFFTVETDGTLPDSTPLADAIARLDAETGGAADFIGVNCAHPSHLAGAFDGASSALSRVGALRVNASKLSHAELDEAEELDEGDPVELGADVAALRESLPGVRVLGGCCGTDHRHVERIVAAWNERERS